MSCQNAIDTWPETVAVLGVVLLYALLIAGFLGIVILLLFAVFGKDDDE